MGLLLLFRPHLGAPVGPPAPPLPRITFLAPPQGSLAVSGHVDLRALAGAVMMARGGAGILVPPPSAVRVQGSSAAIVVPPRGLIDVVKPEGAVVFVPSRGNPVVPDRGAVIVVPARTPKETV